MTHKGRYRILFFIGSMGGGGAERQMLELLKRLDRDRFEPLLYLHHAKGELLSEVPEDVPIFSFWDFYSGSLKSKWDHLWGQTHRTRISHLASTIKYQHVDLIVDRNFLATLDACAATSRARIPRVSICCCSPSAEIMTYAIPRSNAATAYKTATRIIAISNNLKTELSQVLDIHPEQIQTRYNLIDIEECLQKSAQFEVTMSGEQIHLLTVGRLSPEKGHRVFLQAFKKLVETHQHTFHWHLLGQGSLKEDLITEAHTLGIENHLTFHGFQVNPFPYYKAADLLIVPSLHEAFGNILIEALACKLPVLATKCPGGPREILQEGRFGGLAEVNDPESLCQQVLHFLDHKQEWKQKAELGYLDVVKNYSYEQGMPRWENLFVEAIEEFRSSGM